MNKLFCFFVFCWLFMLLHFLRKILRKQEKQRKKLYFQKSPCFGEQEKALNNCIFNVALSSGKKCSNVGRAQQVGYQQVGYRYFFHVFQGSPTKVKEMKCSQCESMLEFPITLLFLVSYNVKIKNNAKPETISKILFPKNMGYSIV